MVNQAIQIQKLGTSYDAPCSMLHLCMVSGLFLNHHCQAIAVISACKASQRSRRCFLHFNCRCVSCHTRSAKIEGSDWTDVVLRKDAHDALCTRASGTNPTTGVDTRESLVC